MTHTSKELASRGFPPSVISNRKWRRERGMTIRSMAAMLGVSTSTLQTYETQSKAQGRRESQLVEAKYEAFKMRWEHVPEARRQLEEAVHRDRLYRSAVASARRRAIVERQRSEQRLNEGAEDARHG
jgi:transcriptional regulator with XRE-family HTH domain